MKASDGISPSPRRTLSVHRSCPALLDVARHDTGLLVKPPRQTAKHFGGVRWTSCILPCVRREFPFWARTSECPGLLSHQPFTQCCRHKPKLWMCAGTACDSVAGGTPPVLHLEVRNLAPEVHRSEDHSPAAHRSDPGGRSHICGHRRVVHRNHFDHIRLVAPLGLPPARCFKHSRLAALRCSAPL